MTKRPGGSALLWMWGGPVGLAALGGVVSACRPGDGATQPAQPGGEAGAGALGACGGDWLDASSLPAEIRPDGGTLLLRTAAVGIQRYRCEAIASEAGPSYAWTFVEPRADVRDCHGTVIGRHLSSSANEALGPRAPSAPSASGPATPASPQWQSLDGAYVRGAKRASYTPDGSAGSIPWLLIQSTAHGDGQRGSNAFGNATWISRANTVGGTAPTTGCGASSVGETSDVDYRADYFFWGP